MIIPSRWFAGGKGLDAFRDEMLKDRHISKLVDYPNASDCFPGVDIAGGVCYFVMNSQYEGDCEVVTVLGEDESIMKRKLDEFDVFIRWNDGVPIMRKVASFNEKTLDKVASSRKPFGLPTNFSNFDENNTPDKYKIYSSNNVGVRKVGFVQKTMIPKGKEYVNKWKVLMPKAYRVGSRTDGGIIHPIIAEPGSVCTETFIILKAFDTEQEAKNLVAYIKTRLFRFLVYLRKVTQDATAKVYAFVPDLPMDHKWTDEELYKRYDLSEEEISFIEKMIKEME